MNLFENLQLIKESGYLMSNDEFVRNECEKYGINECSYGSSYLELYLEPTDKAAEEFINKIEADGYKLIEEQKDGIENHESENDVTLVYGKEVEGNRCIIAISIHPSENHVVVSCGYDETENDNEFFENLQTMNEVNNKPKNGQELFALRREAQVTLSHYTVNQIDYIKRGYEKFVKEIGDAYVDERESNASQIKNELAADCVENEIVTSEEFEDIWNAFEKLSKFNSHAHA